MHSSTPVGATVRDRWYEADGYRFLVSSEGFEAAVRVVREKYRDHPNHPACVVDRAGTCAGSRGRRAAPAV